MDDDEIERLLQQLEETWRWRYNNNTSTTNSHHPHHHMHDPPSIRHQHSAAFSKHSESQPQLLPPPINSPPPAAAFTLLMRAPAMAANSSSSSSGAEECLSLASHQDDAARYGQQELSCRSRNSKIHEGLGGAENPGAHQQPHYVKTKGIEGWGSHDGKSSSSCCACAAISSSAGIDRNGSGAKWDASGGLGKDAQLLEIAGASNKTRVESGQGLGFPWSGKERLYWRSAMRPIKYDYEMLEMERKEEEEEEEEEIGQKKKKKKEGVSQLMRRRRLSRDPQTVAARRRRERVSHRIRVLRRLLGPWAAKLDTAAMLQEAASYLAFLHHHLQNASSLYSNHHLPISSWIWR